MFEGKFDLIEVIKKHKVLVLIASILLFVVGVLMVVAPLVTSAVFIWIAIGLVALLGVGAIIKFIVPGEGERRNGWTLAGGIIILLCAVAVILMGIFAEGVYVDGKYVSGTAAVTTRLLAFAAIFSGVFAIFNNIFLLCNCGRAEPGQKGYVIAKGIIGIIVGVALTVFPFFMMMVGVIICGVYFMVISIAGIVLDIKFWNVARKEAKLEKEKVAKEVKEEK